MHHNLPATTVLLAATVMGRSKTVTMDVDAIHEKYGIEPRQLIEVKSLMGDTSDNIPGVKGIGEKTALSLVQTFGSLEGVYANLDDISEKEMTRCYSAIEKLDSDATFYAIRVGYEDTRYRFMEKMVSNAGTEDAHLYSGMDKESIKAAFQQIAELVEIIVYIICV